LYYASSSSVYGANSSVPFRETDNVDNPVSLYAATKKSIELIAHTYTHLYNIPISGFRFFTVYGPMGRPDMAYYKFIDLFFSGKPIQIYNNGDYQNDLYRDFTYIDDIIEGIAKLHERTLINNTPKHLIYNIGNNNPIKLMDFIETLELCLGKSLKRHVKFSKEFLPIQSGDVLVTYASTERLENEINYKPHTSLSVGLQNFTDWYVDYYHKE
jgi:UDP-glucuronate 4-epimerase